MVEFTFFSVSFGCVEGGNTHAVAFLLQEFTTRYNGKEENLCQPANGEYKKFYFWLLPPFVAGGGGFSGVRMLQLSG